MSEIDFKAIYAGQAQAYHRMIAAEDVQGNLLPALQGVAPLAGQRILDLGSGTGRIPLLLRGIDCTLVAVDLHRAMLREQAVQRTRAGGRWPVVQADMRILPFAADELDLVVAGWAIGHLCGWYPQEWQAQVRRVLDEMQRVTRPGGHVLILETLTTGAERPAPPNAALAAYYAWLEQAWGFRAQVLATDYAFNDVEDAVQRTEFFFGSQLAGDIRQKGWQRLPEWTGCWSRPV
jgi:ubiquinone/menaquinone biosynthesis C-methylase UbiE